MKEQYSYIKLNGEKFGFKARKESIEYIKDVASGIWFLNFERVNTRGAVIKMQAPVTSLIYVEETEAPVETETDPSESL